jgi:hypothetical protein
MRRISAMAWFIVGDGFRQEEIEAMGEAEAKMVFIERYDLAPREHDFVRATRAVATPRKPACPLVGTDGNVFSVIGRVRRCLELSGQPERAREFVERATSSASYDAVLQLTFEYVDPM